MNYLLIGLSLLIMDGLVKLKYSFISILLLLCCLGTVKAHAQSFVMKTNAMGWAAAIMNVGMEGRFNNHLTGEFSIYYNPFTYGGNKKISGLAIQPELRYWFCIPYYKHFVGLHVMYADYNVGWTKYRYQGNLFGGGLSYGYQMILSQRCNLEFNIGVGYARMNHDKYEQPKCGTFVGHRHDNYIGITKLGISFIYIIK